MQAITPVPVTDEPPSPAESTFVPSPPEPVTMPVRESSEPPGDYESLTGKSLASLKDERLEISETSSSLVSTADSPVTQALKQTRIAADLDDPERNVQPSPSLEQSLDLDKTPQEHGFTTRSGQTQGPTQSADIEIDKLTARTMERSPVARPTSSAQKKRVVHRTQPNTKTTPSVQPTQPQRDDELVRHPSRSQAEPKASGVSIPMFIGILVVLGLFIRIVGTGSFSGFLIIPIVILGLLWFMSTVVKNSGRKTTSMPRDKDQRK